MLVTRYLFETLKESKKSFLLLGPRQSGKSTLIRELNPDLEINLADETVFLQHLRNPGLIKEVVTNKKTVFIDEIQRIPSLLNTIQYILDKQKPLDKTRFWMTGSSARKLRRGKANLLPGRIFTFELGPLCAKELGYEMDLKRTLSRGSLPGIYLDETDSWKKTLRSYAATYLKEEVQAEALTRNLEGFSRFFEVIASRSGDFIDFSKYAAAAYIERTTATRYFDVFIDTLIVHKLEPFTKSEKRRLVSHPRFYFFDVGVLNGILDNFECSMDRRGPLFEHFVLQQIFSSAMAMDQSIRISTYRTEHGAEVDFIIQRGGDVYALEVKATNNIGTHDLRGLESFGEFYGKKHTPLIAYMGTQERVIRDIEVLPWHKALQRMGF